MVNGTTLIQFSLALCGPQLHCLNIDTIVVALRPQKLNVGLRNEEPNCIENIVDLSDYILTIIIASALKKSSTLCK